MGNNITSAFYLPENHPKRKVELLDNGVFRIYSKKGTEKFKKKYDACIFDKKDLNFVSKTRNKFTSILALGHTRNPGAISKILSFLTTPTPHINKPGSILDIGCSSGIFLANLSDKWQKTGIEINSEACKMAKAKGLKVYNTTIEKFTTRKKFDYIRASHVIEHVIDYDNFFNKNYSFLRPKGKLIIYTPNSSSLSRFIFRHYWEAFYDKTHFTIFNKNSLESIAKKHKFKKVEFLTYFMGYISASLLRLSRINNSSLYLLFFWILVLLTYLPTLIASKLSYGDALFFVFEKK